MKKQTEIKESILKRIFGKKSSGCCDVKIVELEHNDENDKNKKEPNCCGK